MQELTPEIYAIRLDKYLADIFQQPRTLVKDFIAKDQVLVNGVTAKPAYLLQQQDTIQILMPILPEKPVSPPPSDLRLEVVYEDEDMLVINKPYGLQVHPAIHQTIPTLINALIAYGCPLSDLNGAERPGLVHRLDKDTEGLLLIAKHNTAHQALKNQFLQRTVQKKYYAMVQGNLEDEQLTVTLPIGRHPSVRVKMSAQPSVQIKPKEAHTEITVMQRYQTKTLLEVRIHTGRTHQIRVHLAHIGHPILGDKIYGAKNKAGLQLQAFSLSILHPTTNLPLSFTLPISKRIMK